jgi:UDP-N-acetyl-D-galactosamine dehydrogenase
VPDFRNTKVIDIINELASFGVSIQVHDAIADGDLVARQLNVELTDWEELEVADAVIVCVPHSQYREGGWDLISPLLAKNSFVADIHSILDTDDTPEGTTLWRL